MTAFLFNLLLALAWISLAGEVSTASLATGFAAGFVVLSVTSPALGGRPYHRRVLHAVGFALSFLEEVARSGVRVAHDVVTPTSYMRPGIIEFKTRARTDAEITAVANLISLTPGTLCLDVSEDRKTLVIHSMFADSELAQLEALEDRILRLLRGESP